MKAYHPPEIVIHNIKCEDIMTGSQENSYFLSEGTDSLVFDWSEFGIDSFG